MLNHQNICAHVACGSRRRAVSQTFSPPMSAFDWRQNITCAMSRKYHPLPTTPCSRGIVPVRNVACAEQVTAGVMALIGALEPSRTSAFRCGVSAPINDRVRPTTLMTAVGCMTRGARRAVSADGVHRLAAEHGVALELLGAAHDGPFADFGQVEPAALPEERNRIVPDDLLDYVVRNSLRTHHRDRLRHLQR